MAIFITQARFATDGSTGMIAAPEDRAQAVGRLITAVEGKLIASYLTSGHYDILLIFEGPSHEKVEPALAVAAAVSGLSDLKTVTMLATSEMKSAASGAAEDAKEDAKAAAAILKAQQDTVENVQAGRPASYYIASPPVVPAPSRAAPAARATKREDVSKTKESVQSHQERDDDKSV